MAKKRGFFSLKSPRNTGPATSPNNSRRTSSTKGMKATAKNSKNRKTGDPNYYK